MIKTVVLLSGIAGWLASIGIDAASRTAHQLSVPERAFLTAAVSLSEYQVRAAQLAQQVAPTDSALDDSRYLILDDTRLADALRKAAGRREPTFALPTEPDAVHARLLATLATAAGAHFTAEYARQMQASQRELRALCQTYLREDGTDRYVAAAVQAALPGVNVHLHQSQIISAR